MSIKGLLLSVVVALTVVGDASGQDPGLQDSLIIGNLNGSIIPVNLNQEISLPVWIKTDDSVTFFHTPLATEDDYVSMRLGGVLYQPLSLWDDVGFETPNPNSPSPGMTSQSILGFAYVFDPRDPQNFLYTNYQWWHVADFHLLTTDDSTALGDTACFSEGLSPSYGGLHWGVPDGVTQIVPVASYPCLYFSVNTPPEFVEPDPGTEMSINNEFPLSFPIVVTDGDNNIISLDYYFPEDGARLDTVNIMPGYSSYRFSWVPGIADSGQFIATFTADDNHGGVVDLDLAVNVTPAILRTAEIEGFLGTQVTVPVELVNEGENSFIGGFDILLHYGDEDIVQLLGIDRGERVENWEYFHLNFGDSSTVRITGIADINGNGHSIPPGSGPIAYLNLEITDDSTYLGSYSHMEFIYEDINDNVLTDSTGYLLIHPETIPGSIYILNPDDIPRGDINLNGIPWEVSDAVLLVNHIVWPELFPFDAIQLIASDTNRDGVPASVPDLVYLLNIVSGNVIPPPRTYSVENVSARLSVSSDPLTGMLSYRYESSLSAGGILVRLNHGDDEVLSLTSDVGRTLISNDKDGVLSLLLFDYNGGLIYPGDTIFDMELAEGNTPIIADLQVSDRYGNFIPVAGESFADIPGTFVLDGAYPNPFNSTVSIRFSLPRNADVKISIYNVLGRLVRTIEKRNMPPGAGSVVWDGTGNTGEAVASGIYLYRITSGDYEATSRMTFLK